MQQREKNRLTRYYLKPYTGSIIVYFVLMCMATAFSLASILSISNFLQILFGSQLQQNSNPSVLEAVLNEIYLYFIRFGKSNALWIFAAIIFGVYFSKICLPICRLLWQYRQETKSYATFDETFFQDIPLRV